MINKKNKNRKKILLILLILISGILAIILCLLHIYSQLNKSDVIKNITPEKQAEIKEKLYNYTTKEILEAYGCKDISNEIKKDKNNKEYYEIDLDFAYNLYDGTESKEEYFNDIVETVERKLYLPVKMVDSGKDIEIYVDKENNIYKINDVEDYYEDNKYVSVYSHDVKTEDMLVKDSEELNFITFNDWSRYKLNLNKEPESISNEFIDYGSFKVNYIN